MTVKITEKITGVSVVRHDDKPAPSPIVAYERPAKLRGTTYKIKPPIMEAAIYITVNDIELPDGTKRPLEVFLNSKDSEHTEWRHSLTRMLSFILRQPTIPVHLAAEELKQIVDPHGSYFLPKDDPAGRGKVGGVVSHIGHVLYKHCQDIGLTPEPKMTLAQKALLEEKQQQATAAGVKGQECPKCHDMSMVRMDGCDTCVNCGHSKCG